MDRRDLFWAAAAGCTSLAVYVRTLAPGVVAELDTPMFQFIGRVLGVAHNPGYPLYVLLTYPIALLPIGSLPYRINLFSALCGALAVALVFLVARRLGCGRAMSLVAALGLAFGQVFWSQAVIAEVYTMHAALVAGVLLGMLEWGRSRRASWFYAGVAALAAGLAHHTTIVALVPAIAAYAWLTDRRFVLRLRTLLITGAILAAGLLPYGFIVMRSNQPGAYLESKATSVAQLPNVILARQFRDRVFAFDWWTVMTDRLPAIAKGVFASELTIPGLALAIVGAAMLLRRRLADALLLLIGAVAVVAFALNYSVADTPVFLIPALLVLWLLAAVGAEHLAGLARGRLAPRTAVLLTALVLPAWLLAHNFETSDRSRDTSSSVFLDRLFEAFPSRTALVHEDFLVDRLMAFKLLADAAARGRLIRARGPRGDPPAAGRWRCRLCVCQVGPQGSARRPSSGLRATDTLDTVAGRAHGFSRGRIRRRAGRSRQPRRAVCRQCRRLGSRDWRARDADSHRSIEHRRRRRPRRAIRRRREGRRHRPGAGHRPRCPHWRHGARVAGGDLHSRGRDRREHPTGLARPRAHVRGGGPGHLATRRPPDACRGVTGRRGVPGVVARGPLSAYPVRRATTQEVGGDWTDVTPYGRLRRLRDARARGTGAGDAGLRRRVAGAARDGPDARGDPGGDHAGRGPTARPLSTHVLDQRTRLRSWSRPRC